MSTEDIPNSAPDPDEPTPGQAAWTFRGHQMQSAEFSNAMVQLYQAEMQRATTWRTRLDHTTQWSVVATGGALLLAFTNPAQYGNVLIFGTLFVSLFLWIE